MRLSTRRARALITVALASALMVSCGGDDDNGDGASPSTALSTTVEELIPIPKAFVGPVAESKLFIAVVPGDDGTVQVYTCDGIDTIGTVDQWFKGDWDGEGPVTLTGGEFEVTLQRGGDSITGQLTTPAGDVLAFSTTPATEGEGLFVFERRNALSGEIVDRDGAIVNDDDVRGAMVPIGTHPCDRFPEGKCRAASESP